MAELVVAKPYAAALFELALERGIVDICLDNLLHLRTFLDDDELAIVLKHPEVENDEKFNILINCTKGNAPDELKSLLRLLLDKRRIGALKDVIEAFKALVDAHHNIVEAHVYSAGSLSEAQISRIHDMLVKKYNKSFKIKEHLDPSIIGGLRVRVGDQVVDTSIKKDIEDIRNSLLSL